MDQQVLIAQDYGKHVCIKIPIPPLAPYERRLEISALPPEYNGRRIVALTSSAIAEGDVMIERLSIDGEVWSTYACNVAMVNHLLGIYFCPPIVESVGVTVRNRTDQLTIPFDIGVIIQ